jgi:hypothetical protein
MSFKEVYDDLATYVTNKDTRWRMVMRVKRGLTDPDKHGGYGNDQCYFEGKLSFYTHKSKCINFNSWFQLQWSL